MTTLNICFLSLLFLTFFGPTYTFAQTPTTAPAQSSTPKIKLDSQKATKLEYTNPKWNKDPNVADRSVMLFRDSQSGKMAKVELQETGNDTGVFRGQFNIFWSQGQEIAPEVYFPPQSLANAPDQLLQFEKMIAEGTLLRKPFFFKADAISGQVISVFDSKEQALSAYSDYRKNYKGRDAVDKAALDAQRKAERDQTEKDRIKIASDQDMMRKKLEEEERAKQAELKRQQEMLNAAERAKREKEAKDLAAKALALYKQEKFQDAEKLFNQVVELDPANNSFYYQYGVTLYKTEKYNKSIVVLNMATGSELNKVERDYFVALNHLKLKEFEVSYKEFAEIKKTKDPTLSGSSAFFCGVIDFQKENYDTAKSHFEFVIDNSTDPKLDSQAEAYIDQIANMQAFLAEKKKKWILTLNGGLIYDSNILSVSNSSADSGTTTGLDGYRWLYSGSAEYRTIYTEKTELSGVLSLGDMYSTNKSFGAESSFQNTDPLTMSLAVPYKWKGMLFGKPTQAAATVSYETINMNADASGARELILTSYVLKLDNTLIMQDDWFAAYSLEIRKDNSTISTGTDDDQSASKTTLSTTQTFFQDKKKTIAWIYDGGISQNNASGANARYLRYDLGATYLGAAPWNSSWTGKLGLYTANYSTHLVGRKDTDWAATFGWRKPINKAWTYVLSANYTINQSSYSSNDYKKYMITSLFSWNTNF